MKKIDNLMRIRQRKRILHRNRAPFESIKKLTYMLLAVLTHLAKVLYVTLLLTAYTKNY
jgi:hypothetical protein